MKRQTRILGILGATLALALTSCAKKKNGDEWGDGTWDPNGGGWGNGGGFDEFGSSPLPSRDEGVSFFGPGSANVDKSMFPPIYFAFDSYTISGNEMQKVSQVAAFLRGGSRLIIAGFTDQAGTDEYNRVLGERRALAVRSALTDLGANPSLIQTVSFGEDMPADPYNDSANRRAEFGVVR